jgi:two-component sensor histidine kinase
MPYMDNGGPEAHTRLVAEGPDVPVLAGAITGLSLILHEFATNAAKYGALTAPAGRVRIVWTIEDGTLLLSWEERGGPRLHGKPDREGFGTVIAHRIVDHQFSGRLTYDWAAEGLAIKLAIPAVRLADI